MVVTPLRPVGRKWSTLSFASTLYLVPVLDLLLTEVPPLWQPELRLGLQEALVNAAKHGNQLDPSRQVTIHFSIAGHQYWWVITDQGALHKSQECSHEQADDTPCHELECGRGLYRTDLTSFIMVNKDPTFL
ncbi:ATP-binding protein, partial [Tumidithrix elongata RA019]|nr:ATP-binding protein [Tumidithrix elongata RA019]